MSSTASPAPSPRRARARILPWLSRYFPFAGPPAAPHELPCEPGRVLLIISDVHLHPNYPERTAQLLALLRSYRGRVQTVVFLGDLFEYWFGVPAMVPAAYVPVLAELEVLREAGVGIVFFTGNHDFRPGPYIEQTLGARVYTQPQLFTVGSEVIGLSHGDEFDLTLAYRLTLWAFHQPVLQFLYSLLPVWWGWWFAFRLASRKKHRVVKKKRIPNLGLVQDQVWRAFAERGASRLFFGHLHNPYLREFFWSGRTLQVYSMGDFIYWNTFVEYCPEHGFRLLQPEHEQPSDLRDIGWKCPPERDYSQPLRFTLAAPEAPSPRE